MFSIPEKLRLLSTIVFMILHSTNNIKVEEVQKPFIDSSETKNILLANITDEKIATEMIERYRLQQIYNALPQHFTQLCLLS